MNQRKWHCPKKANTDREHQHYTGTNDTRVSKKTSFFPDNKPPEKAERKYTTTRVQSRNCLSNIADVGIKKEDFYNLNFIFDVYLIVTKILNLFLLDRKLNDQNKHEMIYILWKECVPQRFYKHICKEKSFFYLKGRNVLQPKISERITDLFKEGNENYIELRKNLSQYENIFQQFQSNVSPEIYCSIERRGFNLKSTFHIMFKTYKDKRKH